MRHSPRLTYGALIALFCALAPRLHAEDRPNPLPSLTVNGSGEPITVARGTAITVDVRNAPGTPGEWVGLYPLDPANSTYITWRYLDGTQGEAAPPGRTSATLTFDLPFTPGDFELRLHPFVGSNRLAVARVSTSAADLPLTVNGSLCEIEVRPGAVVSVAVKGPGNALDWVGLHQINADDRTHVGGWKYLNNSTDPPSPPGVRQATVTFQMPSQPGIYNFRFFLNDKYTRIAKSAPVFVSAPKKPGTIDGADQPDDIPDLMGFTRLFETLRWRNEFGLADEALSEGLDEAQTGIVLNALESYVQGTPVASLMVSLRADLGPEGYAALEAYTRGQIKPSIQIIPGEN